MDNQLPSNQRLNSLYAELDFASRVLPILQAVAIINARTPYLERPAVVTCSHAIKFLLLDLVFDIQDRGGLL